MNNEQLAADLHNLLGEVDAGWCAYKQINPKITHATYGIGGCLGEQIMRMVERSHIVGMYWQRHEEIVSALGFTRICPYSGETVSDCDAMFGWNDQQRDPDVIKRRIKDAIEQL